MNKSKRSLRRAHNMLTLLNNMEISIVRMLDTTNLLEDIIINQQVPVSQVQMCQCLGTTIKTLNKWKAMGQIPYTLIGSRAYYIPAAVYKAVKADKSIKRKYALSDN